MAKVQIGLSVDPETNDEIVRLASPTGMSRPQFIMHLIDEAIRADLQGRRLFEPREVSPEPTVDPRLLVELTGQMSKLTARLGGVLRTHDRHDAQMMQLALSNVEVIEAAELRITDHMLKTLTVSMVPVHEDIDAIAAEIGRHLEALTGQLSAHCTSISDTVTDHPGFRAIASELGRQRSAIEKARPNVQVYIGGRWATNQLGLAGGCVCAFIASFLLLAATARIFPDDWVAVPAARWLFGSEERASCALSGNRYVGAHHCITPSGYAS